jgi:hypothetical protein
MNPISEKRWGFLFKEGRKVAIAKREKDGRKPLPFFFRSSTGKRNSRKQGFPTHPEFWIGAQIKLNDAIMFG